MKDWKTTTAAAISALASFVVFAQNAHYIAFPPWSVGIAAFCQIGGLAAFGIVASDRGGTPPTSPA